MLESVGPGLELGEIVCIPPISGMDGNSVGW